jgi:REase_AHJR-like
MNFQTRVLDQLRVRYVSQGYSFAPSPDPATLPPFMAGYQPDAIARKGQSAIAIQLSNRRAARKVGDLKDVAARFHGQPGWEFHIVYAEDTEPELGAAPDRAAIAARLAEVEALAGQRPDAALVLAWAVFEATARLMASEAEEGAPRSPGEAAQMLEYLGRIDRATAATIRLSLDLRHQIVHGDFTAEVPPAAVTDVTGAVRLALAA